MTGRGRGLLRACAVLATVLATLELAAGTVVPPEQFFPFGAYIGGNAPIPSLQEQGVTVEAQIEAACADLESHHFNAVWVNNLSPKYLDAWLAAGTRHRIRVVVQGAGMPMYLQDQGPWKDRWAGAIEAQVLPFYRSLAMRYRDSSALLAYSIVEEIGPGSPFFPHIATITHEMATRDPRHPVIALYNRATSAARAAREIKPRIVAYDIYPFFASKSGPQTWPAQRSYYEGHIGQFYQAARECGAPLWVMAQAWSSRRVDATDHTTEWLMARPTRAQMRYQVWMALFQGAKGIFFYAYQDRPNANGGVIDEQLRDRIGEPMEHYDEAARLSKELDRIRPLLLRLDIAPIDRQAESWQERAHVHGQTFVHRDTGERYLLVVNTDLAARRPIDLEWAYQGAARKDDRFYDLETGTARSGSDLHGLALDPGAGRMFLIGGDDAWRQHEEWFRKRAST